jgi:hypothetical protein
VPSGAIQIVQRLPPPREGREQEEAVPHHQGAHEPIPGVRLPPLLYSCLALLTRSTLSALKFRGQCTKRGGGAIDTHSARGEHGFRLPASL